MSHEERLKLIREPFSFSHRYARELQWGGVVIESHPLSQRQKTPADQDADINDEVVEDNE